MIFGEYLRQKRTESGLSMRKLEELSGVSNSYLSQLERGTRSVPTPKILKDIAPHLNVSYEELLKAAGYLNDDFNMSNFGANLILVRGKTSKEAFAAAIQEESGNLMFTAELLDTLENGSIVPTEDTIEMLSSFAGVHKGFWYKENDFQALINERQFCESNKDSDSRESRDGMEFHNARLPLSYSKELVEWLQNEDSLEYLEFAKTLYDKEINISIVKSALFKNNRECT